jgi:hypothetical protein
MKSFILKSIAFGLIAMVLWSCKKDEAPVVASSGTSGSLQSSASTLVLDKTMLSSNVITFTMGDADFGYQAAITNTLQLSAKGQNFAADKTKEFTLEPKVKSKSYNGFDFNNLLLALNLPTASGSDVEIRVKSSISNTINPVYSNVVTINARPFPLTSWVYVPGAYQGWDILKADSLISPTGNGVYSGVINFVAANSEFKVTPAKKWDFSYGDLGGGKLGGNTGGNLKAAAAGPQLLTVDLNTMVWTLAPAARWSVIGDAVPGSGWFLDTDMKFINDGNGQYKLITNLLVGEFKFRKNYDWGTTIGNGAANIKVTAAGNYTLVLTVNADGKTGTYTMIKN